MNKFFIYTIDQSFKINKVYANIAEVKFFITQRNLKVLRAGSDQMASVDVSGNVVWTDIEVTDC